MSKALGDYSIFNTWSGKARSWGPDGSWRAWFGGNVIDGLCQILDEHLAAPRSRRLEAQPAVVGCVPWFTSNAVQDRLVRTGCCCIVIDKGAAKRPDRLIAEGRGLPNVLPGLHMTVPDGEGPTLLGPYSELPVHPLGPVRLAGWRRAESGRVKPLLHTKILVLGEVAWYHIGPDDVMYREEFGFRAESVWWGSANWTDGSRSHLEMGTFSSDPALVDEALRFVSQVVEFSEPIGSGFSQPEPNLVPVNFDDDAMWEAYEEYRLEEPHDE